MTKYNDKIKRDFIELVKSNKHSLASAAKELGVNESAGKRWWKMYSIHGVKGLNMKSGTYTGEFKVNAVKYMHNNMLSGREASARLGIPSDVTLLKWERIYYEEGEEGLFYENRGRPNKNMSKKSKNSNKRFEKSVKEDLICEIKKLRVENAYLKKYNALIREKKELQTKRKQK